MRTKQQNPKKIRRKNRLYSPTALTNAYMHIKENGTSVRKASKLYGVPESTLRDRTLGLVHIDTLSAGGQPLFDEYEEANLVSHFKTMAGYGHGYTRQECVDIATDYAVQLGRRTQDRPLTMKWMRGFLKRWPELKVVKPKGLEHARAKMASRDTVMKYFINLKETIENHNIEPHLIFNIDEKAVKVEHKPPHVVSSSSYIPSAVTSGKGQIVTLIGAGSAAGQAIPPYLVFPGQRMRSELMIGASPGADGTVSETGWSNGSIFRYYLEHHFLKFVPGRNDKKILVILDGHKSHVSVGLSEWAHKLGIVIFILPPHCSHILQPMDVGCFGPFQKIYDIKCHKLIREVSSVITRYNICQVSCSSYLAALTPNNVQAAFRRAGIYPFDPLAIAQEKLLPAEVFRSCSSDTDVSDDSQATVIGGVQSELNEMPRDIVNFLHQKEASLKRVKNENKTKPRNTMSKIVAGKEINESVLKQMTEHVQKQGKSNQSKSKVKQSKQQKKTPSSPQPGPSCINLVENVSDTDSEIEIDESELCCKCKKFTPVELLNRNFVKFTTWGQCESCGHWVHLIYCTSERVLRRGDHFVCPCCKEEE
ncbi:uncharacterized protein LOC132724184 [Ruditapes philippinarum]|uniref:uncharacterized protein LOC132724184 n=1 Tax=Ruditapes philippinarum TaxID=129788 RepID=UPI00295BAD64|nr:uncharacterized protein LOC132724184 [Ruditapes philippinarum]